jgi:uncharacterized protein (DUF2164 family)
MQRKFDNISDEVRKKCIAEVITRVEEADGSEVGVIAAQDIIDIVTQNLGPEIYNLGVRDTKKLMQEKFSDLGFEIDQLEQS